MKRHLTINGTITCCGWRLGESVADSYTTDPEQVDCPECHECLSRPQYGSAEETTYSQGYADGKEKGYFELEHWLPNEHSPGCGCRPCSVARSIFEKVFQHQAWR